MGFYYFIPLIVSLALGTILVYFITTTLKFPNATLTNSLLLSFGWITLLYFSDTLNIVFELLGYLILIMAIYKPPLPRALILFTVSIIIRLALPILVGGSISSFIRYNFF